MFVCSVDSGFLYKYSYLCFAMASSWQYDVLRSLALSVCMLLGDFNVIVKI
jgi:hypothetical protein